jgi:16S rRNA A1518/A1519 N6-dimethyltransferase RsmA/KsgA/DIM1 with predicted DNA glycosylase/AP lyase activity
VGKKKKQQSNHVRRVIKILSFVFSQRTKTLKSPQNFIGKKFKRLEQAMIASDGTGTEEFEIRFLYSPKLLVKKEHNSKLPQNNNSSVDGNF